MPAIKRAATSMSLFQLICQMQRINSHDKAEALGPKELKGLAFETTESSKDSIFRVEKQQKVGQGQFMFDSSKLHKATCALRMLGIVLH